ncbi:PilW family protein [Endozoicomonas sp.]|uniref:PilW family protein n=1 Tax=Endozoicomonas sp. TaxID=1892382 RepID=UPI00383BBBB8
MKPWDRTPNANQQTGISLIELMIALTLSSLLMLGVMRMFMDSTRSSATDSALVQVQDSARIAMEMIKRDVRMAGYRGSCVSADAEPTPGSIVDFDRQSVTGIEDDKIGVDIVSDTLSILRAEEWSIDNPVRITSFYDTANADNNTIDLTRAITTTADEVLLISDCRQIAALNPV